MRLRMNTSADEPAPSGNDLLLDGAVSHVPPIDTDLKNQILTSSDRSNPTEDRISAFRDIIDREIGDTALTRGRNIEREINLRNLYLKFEGGNPTGTHKDRIAFAQVLDALRRGYEAVTLATCGNYGAAMALACNLAGLKCIIFIPEGYKTKRLADMTRYGAEIHFSGRDYEDSCDLSRTLAAEGEIYDANPGGANTVLQLEAYAQISYEIYDELRDAPAAVAVSVSNGTTLAGIYLGFLSLYRRCKTSRIPKIIAGSSYRKNPIIESYVRGSRQCIDLDPGSIKETEVNEPLINWHSIDGNEALDAIYESGGFASYVSDKAMKEAVSTLKKTDGMVVLPASTAGLIALINRHNTERLPGDRYVAVITGKQS
ncbi:MAG: pyridoxal-phosphate dependent enzyme [Spirochaetales bacterium]|nr:pyridoxal-phosphate dependent enzyme [Spirochaetales bacterium]